MELIRGVIITVEVNLWHSVSAPHLEAIGPVDRTCMAELFTHDILHSSAFTEATTGWLSMKIWSWLDTCARIVLCFCVSRTPFKPENSLNLSHCLLHRCYILRNFNLGIHNVATKNCMYINFQIFTGPKPSTLLSSPMHAQPKKCAFIQFPNINVNSKISLVI